MSSNIMLVLSGKDEVVAIGVSLLPLLFLLRGIFYMSTFNTLLSATWQGICNGYHCLKCETTHAYGVPHFLCLDHPMYRLQIGDAKDKLGVLKFSGQVLVRQEISVKKYLLCESNFCGL
ncbi:hypothetical protein D5086_003894 [Populus alba]|uniref:Uncharacterized protein n=1 Tax=Populus alba TaxID=43335 RepID=A0ACC4D6H3_POPAL